MKSLKELIIRNGDVHTHNLRAKFFFFFQARKKHISKGRMLSILDVMMIIIFKQINGTLQERKFSLLLPVDQVNTDLNNKCSIEILMENDSHSALSNWMHPSMTSTRACRTVNYLFQRPKIDYLVSFADKHFPLFSCKFKSSTNQRVEKNTIRL